MKYILNANVVVRDNAFVILQEFAHIPIITLFKESKSLSCLLKSPGN